MDERTNEGERQIHELQASLLVMGQKQPQACKATHEEAGQRIERFSYVGTVSIVRLTKVYR